MGRPEEEGDTVDAAGDSDPDEEDAEEGEDIARCGFSRYR